MERNGRIEGSGSSLSVFCSDRKYWSERMKTALGLVSVSGFPHQLSPLKTKTPLPIPAVDFEEGAPSLARRIFYHKISRRNSKNQAHAHSIGWGENLANRSKHEILAPTAKLRSVLRDAGLGIFDSGFSLTPQIRAFYQFHVYFTIRRVLYQLGGIQSISALPADPTFNQFNNHMIMKWPRTKRYALSSG